MVCWRFLLLNVFLPSFYTEVYSDPGQFESVLTKLVIVGSLAHHVAFAFSSSPKHNGFIQADIISICSTNSTRAWRTSHGLSGFPTEKTVDHVSPVVVPT